MNKIEHIGIAVKDINKAGLTWEKLLSTPVYKVEELTEHGVKTAFLKVGDNKIELLESLEHDGIIAKFIATKGEGVHHIAFEVGDIEAEMMRLRNDGFVFLTDKPLKGADNKLVCFVHPKEANGVLIELCQENSFNN